MDIGNIVTAMVTPFDEALNVDYDKTSKLIDHLIETGTDAVVVAGTTGESPTLSKEEKIALFKHVVEYVDGRIPVIAGTGCNNTAESIALTKEAEAVGVDGIMLVIPYYNKPSQAGLYAHFSMIAKATQLPVMLYNIPGRSGVNLEAKTTIELSKIENIKYVKEASADLEQMAEIIQNTADDFLLYSGDDSLTIPVLSIGGRGVVSVSAHLVGNRMQEMIQSFQQGQAEKAAGIHRELLPFFNTMFIAPNPTALKEGLNQTGVDVGSLRLPLIDVNETEKEAVSRALKNEDLV